MTFFTLFTLMLSLVLTWLEKYDTMWKYLITPLLNLLKTNEKLHFTTLNYISYYNLQPKLWISIQVNTILNFGVQSVTRAIVWGAKCVLKKFRVGTKQWFKLRGAEVLCSKIVQNWISILAVDKVALLALIY